MKKKIIIGSLLVVCILMVSSSISAVEVDTSVNEKVLELQKKAMPIEWFLALLAFIIGMMLSYIWHTAES